MHESRLVILGANGQLGSALQRRWDSRALGLSRADIDLADLTTIHEKVRTLRPAVVVNCAAYTAVDRAEQDAAQCFRVNAEAVEVLAEVCNDLGAMLVQMSTDYVFGGDGRLRPYAEADRPQPKNVYGRSKTAGEKAAAGCNRHLIVRTCGLYGHGGQNFVERILSRAKKKELLRIVDDQRCTPSYVEHVARGIEFLVESGQQGLFQVVNGGSTTWHDFAAEIIRLTALDVALEPIDTSQYASVAARPAYSVLDTARYQQAGGPELPNWPLALAEYLAVRATNDSGFGKAASNRDYS